MKARLCSTCLRHYNNAIRIIFVINMKFHHFLLFHIGVLHHVKSTPVLTRLSTIITVIKTRFFRPVHSRPLYRYLEKTSKNSFSSSSLTFHCPWSFTRHQSQTNIFINLMNHIHPMNPNNEHPCSKNIDLINPIKDFCNPIQLCIKKWKNN